MAGRDLLADTPQQAAPPAAAGRDLLADPAPTPEQQRADRLRKIALSALKTGSGEPGAGDRFSDAYTLGLMKPVNGLATGASNWLTGKSGFGEGYTAGTGAYQDYIDEGSKNSGWGGTAADVAGGILSGGPARGIVKEGLWPMVKNAVGLGAVEGAARNSEDPMSALKGAATGAVASGATAGVIGGAIRAPGFKARRAAAREAAQGTPPEELKNQSRVLFKQLDDAGVAYDNNQSAQMVDDLTSDLRQNGYDPQGAHKVLADGVVSRLEGQRGQPMSLETLQQIRSQASSNATNPDPNVRRIAGRIMNSIDGFVTKETPAVAQVPGSQIGPMWTEARRLWRTANTAEDIGWRVDKAARRAASTNSGQNEENAIRQNIRGVLDKSTQPGRFNPYNAAELAQMERVIGGTPKQNVLRWAGNQVSGIPAGAVMGGLAGAAGLSHGVDPASALLAFGGGLGSTAAMQGIGHAIKGQSTQIAQDEADALIRLISTGSLDQLPGAAGPPTREALARLMRAQTLARGAGVAAGGEVSR